MSTDWSYLLADLMTDTALEELPLSGVSFDSHVNGYGELRAGLDLSSDDAGTLDLPGLLQAGERALYAYRDGRLVWAGILWRVSRPQSTGVVTLQCFEFESYLERRLLLTDLIATGLEQLELARRLVEVAQDVPGGSIGLVPLYDTPSGVLRTLTWAGTDARTVLSLLSDLADSEDGFDFRAETIQDSDGGRARMLRLGYPRLGQRAVDSALVFESPGTILDWTDEWDGWRSVTSQIEVGQDSATTPPVPLRVTALSDLVATRNAPLLEQVSTDHNTLTDPVVLAAAARTGLASAPLPVYTATAVVQAGADPALGSYQPGDEARFEVTDLFYRAGRDGSAGLSVALRILSMAVDPDSDQVTLTLGPAYTGVMTRDPVPPVEVLIDRLRRLEAAVARFGIRGFR